MAWRENKVYSVVFLDIEGAFNNVHHQRLIHNMRKRHIPERIAKWVESFLHQRTTRLKFNSDTSQQYHISAGIPQGSPLSPILYIIYNSDLLDIPQSNEPGLRNIPGLGNERDLRNALGHGNALGLGFIDDIAYGVKDLMTKYAAKELEEILASAENWRIKHGAKFEKSKFVLIHFLRYKIKDLAPVKIGTTTIIPSNEVKYLGVILDQTLKFKSHLEYISKKGTKFVSAMARIVRSTWGADFKHLQRLFTTVVAPRIDYAAIIWHQPYEKRLPIASQIKKLTTIQRLAMKSILGCFKTTSIQALQIESGLPPAEIHLKYKILCTAIRMKTMPPPHPMYYAVSRAVRVGGRFGDHTVLESLVHHHPDIMEREMETIRPFINPPWWSPNIRIRIDKEKKKEAVVSHYQALHQAQQRQALIIYTDGSGIDGKIGAAIVATNMNYKARKHLGTNKIYNVFGAELEGIHMATTLAYDKRHEHEECIIFTDNQSAIQATYSPARRTGQATIAMIHDRIKATQHEYPQYQIQIQWVPSHENIEGNEKADIEAKAAATTSQSNPPASLRTAIQQHLRQTLREEWKTITMKQKGTYGTFIQRRVSQGANISSKNNIYKYISKRKHVTWIARLRTGYCSLNKYLHRMNIIDDPTCACEDGPETVSHFLCKCQIYDKEREKLRLKVGMQGMNKEILLGDINIIPHTLEFIESTGRFHF